VIEGSDGANTTLVDRAAYTTSATTMRSPTIRGLEVGLAMVIRPHYPFEATEAKPADPAAGMALNSTVDSGSRHCR